MDNECSVFHGTALALAEAGYPVFPLIPGEKIPFEGTEGRSDATEEPEAVDYWWSAQPKANIGLSTEGLIAIDVDREGLAWLQSLPEDRQRDLLQAARQVTPSGGMHFLYKQPDGINWLNGQSLIAPGVDHRANGGYIVVAPSEYQGKRYRWVRGAEIPRWGPEDLLYPPLWLVELIEEVSGEARATATHDLDLSSAIDLGDRHRVLVSMAGRLRTLGLSYEEILPALEVFNARRCNPPKSPKELEKIARSIERYEPGDLKSILIGAEFLDRFGRQPFRVGQHVIIWGQEGATGEDEEEEASASAANPGPFPDKLLDVPGFIRQVMDWNLSTAYKPQPRLALGCAISLQATLAGRKIRSPSGSRTNLFIIGLAPSATGKDKGMSCNRRILEEADCLPLLGPGDLTSDSALVNSVSDCPSQLIQIDEIGRFMSKLVDPRATHEYAISSALLKLWSTAAGTYAGKGFADTDRNVSIVQPCLNLYGASVPGSLFRNMKVESLSDGFIARLIFINGDTNPTRQTGSDAGPPQRITDQARWWARYQPGGNLAGANHSLAPAPSLVPMSDEADERLEELACYVDRTTYGASEAVRAVWGRACEQANRLALVYAASECAEDPFIDLAAMEWATAFAEYNAKQLLYLASEWVSKNDFDATQLEVVRFIRSKGGEVTRSKVTRFLRRETPNDRNRIINNLISTGSVIAREERRGGRGPLTMILSVPGEDTNGGA